MECTNYERRFTWLSPHPAKIPLNTFGTANSDMACLFIENKLSFAEIKVLSNVLNTYCNDMTCIPNFSDIRCSFFKGPILIVVTSCIHFTPSYFRIQENRIQKFKHDERKTSIPLANSSRDFWTNWLHLFLNIFVLCFHFWQCLVERKILFRSILKPISGSKYVFGIKAWICETCRYDLTGRVMFIVLTVFFWTWMNSCVDYSFLQSGVKSRSINYSQKFNGIIYDCLLILHNYRCWFQFLEMPLILNS